MRQYAPLSRWADHRETHGRSRNTDVEGKRMIRALEAAGLAWLMFNGALCVPMIVAPMACKAQHHYGPGEAFGYRAKRLDYPRSPI
jgi:hypothetical protein